MQLAAKINRCLSSDWMNTVRDNHSIHNIVALRPALRIWVIRWDGGTRLDWMDLTAPHQKASPFHFEIYFGKEGERDKHHLQAIAEAATSDDVVLKELFGFWDLFYAVPDDEQRRTFLHVGQFCRAQPDWQSISDHWRGLTGLAPASANPDFAAFVRMSLGLPTFEAPVLDAVSSFVKKYAAFLTRRGTAQAPSIHEELDSLNRDVFSRLWPTGAWMTTALHADRLHRAPWENERRSGPWIHDGFGISRPPTTVMTLMPADMPDQTLEPLRTLVRNVRLQRSLFAFVRSMPETAATWLQDYGVVIVTSADPGLSPLKRRLELLQRAERLQAFVRENLQLESLVGIGRTMPSGMRLHSSYREAMVALHMCVQLGAKALFFDQLDHQPVGTPVHYATLQRGAEVLMAAFERERDTETRLASDAYVQLVLSYSAERIDIARGQFLATLSQLLKRIEKRYPIRADARARFAADLFSKLEEATSLSQVIEGYKDALARLARVSSPDLHGPKVLQMEATSQYLRENYTENLRLPDVARLMGFSVPVFTRAFKAASGTSFLAHVRALRVEHAKGLLTSSELCVDEVAQRSGFQSQHHLLRSFKKLVGQTPMEFRRMHAARWAQSLTE